MRSRRQWLAGAAATAVLLHGEIAGATPAELPAALQDPVRSYLTGQPEEADIHRLAVLLRLPADAPSRLRRGQPMARADRYRLASTCREEVASGELVNASGWFVTRTEIRLLALLHLVERDGRR